jgi:hypothetical protein
MNTRFLIAWVVVFVVWMAGSFVAHGVLLNADYAQLPNLYRPQSEAQSYMHFMLLSHLLFAGAFVWIYARGREDKPWLAQGIRFGVAVALLTAIPSYMIYYVVQPLPGMMVIKQTVLESALLLVLGLVTAFLARKG